MSYALDDGQLLRIWTVIRFLGEIRNICDAGSRSELLTEAQVLLTALVLELTPLTHGGSQSLEPSAGGVSGFDLH